MVPVCNKDKRCKTRYFTLSLRDYNVRGTLSSFPTSEQFFGKNIFHKYITNLLNRKDKGNNDMAIRGVIHQQRSTQDRLPILLDPTSSVIRSSSAISFSSQELISVLVTVR